MHKARLLFICTLVLMGASTAQARGRRPRGLPKENLKGTEMPPEGKWLLWYRQSANKWEEALPVGNGRIGAMVFGRVGQERIHAFRERVES